MAVCDRLANGGNGNGLIDPGDRIFSSLRLWTDDNHNGVSEAAELDSLSGHRIAAIDLRYHRSTRKDRFGNAFRFHAAVLEEDGKLSHGLSAWDVILRHER